MSEAVLICNGMSAAAYEAPAGVFCLTINGGFLTHRADAAITVDCPGHLRQDWARFQGIRVVAKHMPEFPQGERFDCFELVKRFSSTTPAALAWLAQRKGFRKVTVVGLDSLWGAGDKNKFGALKAYNAVALDMVEHMAQYFPDGLFVVRGPSWVRVGSPEFRPTLAKWANVPLSPPAPKAAAPSGKAAEPPPPLPECTIPQTLVEFDVSPRCTRACGFCAPGIPEKRRKLKKFLTLKAHNKVIDELVAVNFDRPDRTLCYCGHGEPGMNRALPDMLAYARRSMPQVQIYVYTNTDTMSSSLLSTLAALDARVIADLYDEQSGPTLAQRVYFSSMPPQYVLVLDHTDGKQHYVNRSGTVQTGRPEDCRGPCRMAAGKLFVTDNDKGDAAYLLCCDDYGRETLLEGTLGDAVGRAAEMDAHLAQGKRAAAHVICMRCNRHGTLPSGFDDYPRLTAQQFWPPPAPVEVKGRRLIILPCCMKWAENALHLLAAIESLSTMKGDTLIFWNDRDKCPENLRGPGRIVWERDAYPNNSGWTAINRGIGEALEYALSERYDYAIKLDTDTALLRRGWDAAILAGSDPEVPEMRGFLLEEKVWEWAREPLTTKGGIFTAEVKALLPTVLRWAAGHVNAGWFKGHHMQGGCYALTRAGIQRLADAPCGLVPNEAEAPIGEDILQSLRCRVANVKQTHVPAIVSHYFPNGSYDPSVVRYYRDAGRASVIHPIKDAKLLSVLAREAAGCASR